MTRAEIDTEAAADVTAAGVRNAAAARAALPAMDSKQAAWSAILGDLEMSNEVLEATVAGFMGMDQAELVAGFTDAYFSALPAVWAERSNEIAQTITTGLFPSLQFTQETIDKANEFLATVDVPFGCKRLVGEGRDALVRALKAQAADS